MLTRSPGRMMPSVVIASVWGMSMTEKASGQTSTSVRLTPSTAIDPLDTRRGVQAGSMPKARNSHSPSCRRSRSVAVVSICPWTKCPPSRAPTLSARSRLTRSPAVPDSQVGSVERFGPGLDLEGLASGRHNGQAATAHGHALAELERFAGGKARPGDREASPAIFRNDLLEPTQSFNQSREHVHALLVARRDPAD